MTDDPLVSGIFTIRNAIEAGYPFMEAILSVLPAVDEFLLADGGSDDGTREALGRLADQYDAIEVYDIPDDGPSDMWENIDNALNTLIGEAEGEWLFEAQGDEIWHEADIRAMRRLFETIPDEYNSIRQRRFALKHGQTTPKYVMWTVRAVRNVPDLTSCWGGDWFQIGDEGGPTEGYTNHHVPPEYESVIPFYHYTNTFPENMEAKLRRTSEWLATENTNREASLNNYLNEEMTYE